MKQYKITSLDLVQDSAEDCYIPPDDPIHELKAATSLGGLGGEERLASYRSTLRTHIQSSNKGQIQKEKGIKPGSEEWFKLFFGK